MSTKQFIKGVHWKDRGVYRKKIHFTRRVDCLIYTDTRHLHIGTVLCETASQANFIKRLWKRTGLGDRGTRTHIIDQTECRIKYCRIKLYEYSVDNVAMRMWSHCSAHARWLTDLWTLSGTKDISGCNSSRFGSFRHSNHMYMSIPDPSVPVEWGKWQPHISEAHFKGQEIDGDDVPF